jgi:hypothetical protein
MSKNTKSLVPAYLVLVKSLLESCERLGLVPLRTQNPDGTYNTVSTLPENGGNCFLRFGDENAPAIIVPKGVNSVPVCHSHIDLADMECWRPIPKYNGRVVCHIDSATADWDAIIALLPAAAKRPIARAKKVAAEQPDMSSFLATLGTLGNAKAPASETETPVSTETEDFSDDSEELSA